MTGGAWTIFAPTIGRLLGEDDDPALWAAVIGVVYRDAQALCRLVPSSWEVTTQLGRCSHWLRPHQTRWTADGGFAWPTGYAGRRWSREGLPEFDWSCEWCWRPDMGCWAEAGATQGVRRLVLRVAVPARSRRHRQAAVHTVWRPGEAFGFDADVVQFYGFRRQDDGSWACTAYRASPVSVERLYELAPHENPI
jgi:hypothetical protein